jgi:altronate hydrolase
MLVERFRSPLGPHCIPRRFLPLPSEVLSMISTPSLDGKQSRCEWVRLSPRDNIAIAVSPLDLGQELLVEGVKIQLQSFIPPGHKFALQPIPRGERILKYGEPIGAASLPISPGAWVHVHNVTATFVRDEYEKSTAIPDSPVPILGRTFEGYRRENGRCGTRNYIAVISTVNCSASVSKYVARTFTPERLRDYPQVDGVFALTHHGGCAIPLGAHTHQTLNRVLGGLAKHPNVGGCLLIGLGCEQAAADILIREQQLVQLGTAANKSSGIPVLTMQDLGGTAKTVQSAIEHVERLLPQVNAAKRVTLPASELILGTECGGSDGNSGITANPALGYASDLIVACGGTTILSETTEIFGAEHLLTRRATTPDVADQLLARIEWWKNYAGMFGAELDHNPSIGNKAGGLTTIVEKSLGAIAKGGTTALRAVYEYAERVREKGFVIMDTPGYDPASVTGLMAGGANVIAFTTGRGSCFGSKPSPSIKIATNTTMYERMIDDMDIDAGTIMSGETIEQVGTRIFEEILAVASGKKTKSEVLGIGDEEFVPWLIGPML